MKRYVWSQEQMRRIGDEEREKIIYVRESEHLSALAAAETRMRSEALAEVAQLRDALKTVVDGNDIAASRNESVRSWPESYARRVAIRALEAARDAAPAAEAGGLVRCEWWKECEADWCDHYAPHERRDGCRPDVCSEQERAGCVPVAPAAPVREAAAAPEAPGGEVDRLEDAIAQTQKAARYVFEDIQDGINGADYACSYIRCVMRRPAPAPQPPASEPAGEALRWVAGKAERLLRKWVADFNARGGELYCPAGEMNNLAYDIAQALVAWDAARKGGA